MKRYFDLDAARRDRPGPGRCVTIGFFDGVHRGHVRILKELQAWAAREGDEPAVVTFDRHPQAVLGGHPPVPLISLAHRLVLLEREGVEATLVLPFDRELASWSPERFAREVLHESLGARRLLFGFDSAFGRRRRGTYETVRASPEVFGLEVRRAEAEYDGGDRVSSTLIRERLAAGDLGRVEELLGRPFSLLGRVIEGERRGQGLGFPTANLDIGEAAMLPRGVYFADAALLGADPRGQPPPDPAAAPGTAGATRPAVVNVGRSPTFSGDDAPGHAFDPARDRVEVHILDFEGDLYGQWIEVLVRGRHRSERRFPSVGALAAQIRADVEARRQALRG